MAVLIDSGIISRTIRIKYAQAVGTAFVLGDGQNVRIIVTAAHLMQSATQGDHLHIRHKGDWSRLTIAHIERAPCGSDVCAIAPTTQFGEGLPYDALNAECYLGDDVAFCGFPLGLEMKGIIEPAYPNALVKAGIFSGEVEIDGKMVTLYDAINNVGFSGAPIVALNRTLKRQAIVGVVSGYKYDAPSPVLSKDEKGREVPSQDHYVRTNSGFMYGVSAHIVRALVNQTVAHALANAATNGLMIR